jgi:hypothetical protein
MRSITKQATGPNGARCSFEIRRRPTLPGTLVPSTIGAGGLNYRVRNGYGCDPTAIATEIFWLLTEMRSTNCQKGVL